MAVINVDPAFLTSTELKNAFAILSNLPLERFNKVKRVLNLSIPDVLGPTTLTTFVRCCVNAELDLSSEGVRRFKSEHPPLNPDLPILEITAGVYYDVLNFDADMDGQNAWMEFAKAELTNRVREFPGDADNPRIVEYHKSTNLPFGIANDDETPWCSSFVNWCLMKADVRRTRNAMARSWLNWGEELQQPRYGCVAVLTRGNPPKGHVGFFLGNGSGRISLLGGNQGDAVTVRQFSEDALLSYRWPRAQDRL